MPPVRAPPPRPENAPVLPMKRSLDSVESLDEVSDGSQASSQKYFQVDPSKVYLKITDIARKGNNMFNLTVLSWLFPTEEGAKIPHSSVICFGDEISYCKSGLIRRKFSGQFSQDTITSLIEFDNVLDRTEYDLEYFLDQCKDRFNAKSYSLFKNNCNHFSFKMLHYFGNHTDRLTNLPAYQYKVRDRAATGAAAAAGVGAIGAGTVALMTSEAAFWTIMNVAGGPVAATVATTVVGGAIAYLSKRIIPKLRRKSSNSLIPTSSQEDPPDEESSQEPFEGFDHF